MQGEWIRSLLDAIENGEWFLVAVTLFFAALSGFSSIARYMVNRRKVQVANIEEAWRSKYCDGESQEALRRQAAAEYFNLATGIRLEKEPREALMAIYNRAAGGMPFVHFKRAARLARYEKEKLDIHISRLDWFLLWVGLLFGGSMSVIGIPLILLFIAIVEDPWSRVLGAGYMIVSAVVLLLQALPIWSAYRVKREIARQAACCTKESR